jgi:hypothetical protein
MSYKSAFREFSVFPSLGSILITKTGVCETVFGWAMTWLTAQQDFSAFVCFEIFKSYVHGCFMSSGLLL